MLSHSRLCRVNFLNNIEWKICANAATQTHVYAPKRPDRSIAISQYRLLFGFFLLYTDRLPFELLDSAALL
jgi:hypothetical protein